MVNGRKTIITDYNHTRTLNNSNLLLTRTFFDTHSGNFLTNFLPLITQTPGDSPFSNSLEGSNYQNSTVFCIKFD